ncbi:MAG: hypothetical protein WC852_06795 [Candidatus Nanoarchaeia archaeon]|jgi:hypothetical protein
MDYLKYRQVSLKDRIKSLYAQLKPDFEDEIWKAPLREFTYEAKRKFQDKNGAQRMPVENLPHLLHSYIEKYSISVDKDVTLEDAVNLI